MRRRHAPSKVKNLTLCGHETTPQEFNHMLRRKGKSTNCKRCLDALLLRELVEEEEE